MYHVSEHMYMGNYLLRGKGAEGLFWLPIRLVKTHSYPVNKAFPSGPRIPKKLFIHPLTLRRKLNADPETVLKILDIDINEQLSGEDQIRVGSRGSLCINREDMIGCPRGVWFNFETDESGDMFELIMNKKKISCKETIDYASEKIIPFLQRAETKDCNNSVSSENLDKKDDKSGFEKKRSRINKLVHLISSELLPLAGTVAEKYLREQRRIDLTQMNTDTLKFHPNLTCKTFNGVFLDKVPGLVVIASHPSSKIANIQMTYLDPLTGGKHPEAALARRILGSFSDPAGYHYCEISNTLGRDVSFVAEGVETALSVYEAFQDDHVIATLGKHNFARIDPEVLNEKVALVFDNDGKDVWEDKVLLNATKRLIVEGKSVFVVLPPAIEGLEKTDMNDVLIRYGVDAVYNVIIQNLQKVQL